MENRGVLIWDLPLCCSVLVIFFGMGMGCPSTGNIGVTFPDMVRDLQSEAYEYIHGKAGGAGGFT